jgi:Cof subfamily protein (haloacid dehalogenase superfamily)
LENNNNKKIFISDLDGTLLRDDATLSTYSRDKIIELLNAGANFTIASARSRYSTMPILGQIPFRLPVVEINGALISDYVSGEHIFINNIDAQIVPQIFSAILAHECLPFVTTFNGKEDCLYYNKILNDGMQWYFDNRSENNDKRLRRTEDLQSKFHEKVISMNVIGAYEHVKDLAQQLEEDLPGRLESFFFENSYSPSWWWLTIHDQRACKAKAIKTIVEYAGFSLDDLVVFGDNLNDVNMFKMANRAVAVANASEEIKALATEIIGTNEEDSVVKYIAEKTGRG